MSRLLPFTCLVLLGCSGQTHPAPGPSPSHRVLLHRAPTTDFATNHVAPESPPPITTASKPLGTYSLTYFWIADERTHGTKPEVALRDRKCQTIKKVSRPFRRALMREGSGRLADGRVVNIGGGCRCGKRCFVIAGEDSRYGYGVQSRALRPFRSIAAPRTVRVGTVLYVPELDGLTVPGSSPLGGTVHNGCVVADDRGVEGKQLDLFTGSRNTYRSFVHRHGIRSVTVMRAGERCADLDAPGVSNRSEG